MPRLTVDGQLRTCFSRSEVETAARLKWKATKRGPTTKSRVGKHVRVSLLSSKLSDQKVGFPRKPDWVQTSGAHLNLRPVNKRPFPPAAPPRQCLRTCLGSGLQDRQAD